MIPVSVIEDIKMRSDIIDIISPYVSLKKSGRSYKGSCPFHSDSTPSFTVYPETQSYYCFGCQESGDAISFTMKISNLDYISAVEALAARCGIDVSVYSDSGAPRENVVSRKKVQEMNLAAAKLYREMLFDEKTGAPGRQYLESRGIDQLTVKRFGIGYSPDSWDTLVRKFLNEGYSKREIVESGLARRARENQDRIYDAFRNRVTFPLIDVGGNVVGFGARRIDGIKENKYINSDDTPAYKKNEFVFALNFAKNSKTDYFILCEGNIDVVMLHQNGFDMAVATCGTALSQKQARLLKKYKSKVLLSYDQDEPGQKNTEKAIKILEEEGISVKVLKYAGAKDPDEYIRKFGRDSFEEVIEKSLGVLEFNISRIKSRNDMESGEGRIRAIEEMTEFLAGVSSSVEREIYTAKASAEFGISEKSLSEDVGRVIAKRRRDSRKKNSEELKRQAIGSSDKVNLESGRYAKASKTEESILGMIFYRNELLERKVDGRELSADDFITDYDRRLFEFFKKKAEDSGFDMALLHEEFNDQEVSRAFKMRAVRQEMQNNNDEAYDSYVRSLRKEKTEKSSSSLNELLASKRNRTK